ncbi:hypothetical protein lbkm_0539 [Lachnospiraceae bacterium KM106-2]|nr:hypothetical protein lbkm_0539 [Lachnospiraceae bacterium KM106-2]
MTSIKGYDRKAALIYANRFALTRNPNYLDFTNLGGDCTNFISQCLYAGSNVMNYTKTFGWYYNSANDRSPSWTGVQYLYNFLTTNKTKGVFASVVPIEQIMLGDIIQLANDYNEFYHTLIVTMIGDVPSINSIYVNAHDYDAKLRPLNTYQYSSYRCLHIEGVYI